jgi:hypothetical protein
MEAPNPKYQISNKLQSLKSETPSPCPLPSGERDRERGSFEIRIWSLFGIWKL